MTVNTDGLVIHWLASAAALAIKHREPGTYLSTTIRITLSVDEDSSGPYRAAVFLRRLWWGGLLAALTLVHGAQAKAQSRALTHANGAQRWHCELKDGMAQGEASLYSADGQLSLRGSYHQGLKHGLFSYYSRSGKLLERALFVHGHREWRSSDESEDAPLQKLQVERAPELRPARASLERFSNPFLLVIPFSGLNRLSKRMGLALGISTEDGEFTGRRLEFFLNKIKGDYGIHSSAAFSLLQAAPEANEGDKLLQEQLSLALIGSYRLVDRVKHLGFIRGGLLKSIDLEPTDDTPVRGASAGQRPADFAATLTNASVLRLSANYFHMREHFASQVDVGVDAVHHELASTGEGRVDAIVRLNAGVASGTESWKFAAETANSINLGGRSLYTMGGTVTYYSGSNSWTSLNSMVDHNGELSIYVSTGSWLWK